MEAKFSFRSILICSALVVTILMSFVFWSYSKALLTSYNQYKIIFPDSVSGLYEGSIVTYHGVQVGKVSGMKIDPLEDNKVVVLALIDSKIQPKTDTYATLNMKGITGYMNVELIGGSTKANLLKQINGEYIIPYQESMLENLRNAAPRLIHRVEHMLNRLDNTFKSINAPLVATLKEVQKGLPVLIKSFNDTITQAGKVIKIQSDNVEPIIPKIESTLTQLQDFSTTLNQKGLLGALSKRESL